MARRKTQTEKHNETVWTKNFAKNVDLSTRTASMFSSKIRVVRNNRLAAEEAWWRFFNMWNVVKDGYHSYVGRAQLYIPEVRKNIEAQARQLTKAAFPTDDCFDVSPGLSGTKKGAQAWKSVHNWAANNADLELKYFIAMRQACMLGTSPVYLPWKKVTREEFRSRRKDGKISPHKHELELFNGPDFIVRDLFRWYTFNPKIQDLSDGCFEIDTVSPFQLARLEKAGMLANYKQISEGTGNAYDQEEFSRDVMRAESEGIQIQFNTASAGEATIRKDGEDDGNDKAFMRSRVFVDMIFPEGCEDGEDPELPIPMMMDMYGNEACGVLQRNPFWHQSPPYVVGTYIPPNADEFYGQGIPWAIQYMQYEMNTKAEQGMDSATMALNPIAIIDPGLAGASNEFNIEPGAIWWANPAGVKMATMPDVTPIAYAAINNIKSLMENYSDRSPALPPQLMGKSRTATQSEMVSDSLSVDNSIFQMLNEKRVLCPMLRQWESLTDQNMDDEMMVMILGRKAGDLKRTLMSRSDLLGRYAYTWKGATATANKQIVARQMLDGIKIVGSLPPQAQQQINFQYGEVFKTLWGEMWGLPDGDKILGSPEEMVTQDAQAENKMVEMGLDIEVLPMDDDQEHMKIHDQVIGSTKNNLIKTILMAHVIEHKKADDQKQQIKQQQMQQQQFQQQMQALQLQVLQQQAQNGGGKKGAGMRTNPSPNASTGDMASGVRA